MRLTAAALLLVALSACEPNKSKSSDPPPPPPSPIPDLTTSQLVGVPGLRGDIAFVVEGTRGGRIDNEGNSREVFAMAADGSSITRLTRDLTSQNDPAIAPDGSRIYYVCENRTMICASNPDGSVKEVVFAGTGFRFVGSPAISFNGEELLFVGEEGERNPGQPSNPTRLYRFNIASGARQTVDVDTDDGRGGVADPTWTPQGGIVFVKGGQSIGARYLYHLPPGGTEPISLQPPVRENDPFAENDTPTGFHPDVSPDGTKIAYESDVITTPTGTQHSQVARLFTMNLDGTRVTQLDDRAEDPTWSPDGSRIAYVGLALPQEGCCATQEIFVIGADGSGRTRLTRDNIEVEAELDWGDIKVAVSVGTVAQPEGDTDSTFSFQVTLSGPSDQQVTVLYRTVNGSAIAGSDYDAKATDALVFAPGETTKTVDVSIQGDDEPETNESFYLELSNPSGAVLGKAQGKGLIVNDDVPTPTPSISPSPSTSPSPVTISNGRIAFSSSRSGAQQIYTMESNGTDVDLISTDQSSSTLGDPSWSSDAARIIHTALNTAGGQLEVVDRPADGTGSFRALAFDPDIDTEPVYFRGSSTDGFIWASDRDGDFELYYSPLSGGTAKKLTVNSTEDRSPSVSGDGKYVVYHSNSDGDFDIYRLEVSATGDPVGPPENLTQETGAPTTEQNPDYALTKNKITYQGNEHGDLDIFVLDIDTRQELHVTTDAADETFPALSPDGARVAYAKAGDIYVQSAAEGAAATNMTNTGDNGSPDWGPRLGAQAAAQASHEPQREMPLRYAMLPVSALLAGVIVWRRRHAPG